MLHAMSQAGPVMVVLLILSIISVMLVIVYFLSIRRGAVVSHGFMATADALLRKRDYLGLLAVSNRHGEAIARVVQQVLDFTTKNPNADFEQIREIAQTEGTRVASNLNNRVTYLADIGMIAPFAWPAWDSNRNYSLFRCARRGCWQSALHAAFPWHQRSAF